MKKVGGILDNKSGQVTIFIIIAIVIVAVVVGFFFISPRGEVSTSSGFDENNPRGFMQSCLQEDFSESVNKVNLRGGSANPENYVYYESNPVEYLCYTDEEYGLCVIQKSALKQDIESEISGEVSSYVNDCFAELVESYQQKNYEVTLTSGESIIRLLPKKIVLNLSQTLTVKKSDTQVFEGFIINLDNNLYELVYIASSIVDWESTYGDSETGLYTSTYRNVKVEKKLAQNSSKVYILTDVNTGGKFQFASKSLPLPSVYGGSL